MKMSPLIKGETVVALLLRAASLVGCAVEYTGRLSLQSLRVQRDYQMVEEDC
jgi:hypothetical protein